MSQTRGATKARMLDTAVELFRIQGVHATGVAEVLERAEAPRGSLYHHFPGGKEQLAVEAIQLAGERVRMLIEQLFGAGNPADAVRAYGELTVATLERSDFAEGCPVGTPASEASAESPAIRAACDAAFASWEAAMAAQLVADGIAPDEAQRLATFILSTAEGALLLARARRDVAPVRDACEQLARLLEGQRREPDSVGSARSSRRTAVSQ